MFSLSTFQYKGHNRNLFHLRNIQKDVTVSSALIEEFKNVAFAKVESENSNKSTLKEFLPHLVNQDSKSDVKDRFHKF